MLGCGLILGVAILGLILGVIIVGILGLGEAVTVVNTGALMLGLIVTDGLTDKPGLILGETVTVVVNG